MNHRAILKLPLKKIEQTVVQLELAEPVRTPKALAQLLAERLELRGRAPRIRVEPTQEVVWNGGANCVSRNAGTSPSTADSASRRPSTGPGTAQSRSRAPRPI